MATPKELEQAYEANTANIRAACDARIATLKAEHQADHDRMVVRFTELEATLASSQAELASVKKTSQEALTAVTAEKTAAIQKVDEAIAAAGGLATMKDLVKRKRIAEETEHKRKAEVEVLARQKRIDELNREA